MKFSKKFSIFFLLIIILINNINLIKCDNGHMFVLRLYSSPNCTGDSIEFLAVYEKKVYSEIVDILFECNNDDLNSITCNYTNNYKNPNPLKIKRTFRTKVGECSDNFLLDYININNFDYDESSHCVLSEYSTSTCEYKPIFHFGILKKTCVYRWLLDCSALGYNIKHCNNLDGTYFDNPYNYTIDEENSETFNAYVCKNKIQNYSSTSRGYIVHASVIDGYDDQDKNRIIELGPKSHIHFQTSIATSNLLSNYQIIFLFILVSLFLI
ncbi:hypothetical protein RB653_001227 [Dictyostelium firmibasis]|uniref:Uncharacterized protein n=1 Tax=Dictyostelium firmibasis TaxID=79012 RepID=A0AAN7YYI4_9MYCE